MKYLNWLLFFVIALAEFTLITDGVVAESYPSAVAWNNTIYGLSIEEVDINLIGNEIGKVEHLTSPMPKRNGESNDKPVGSLLFEIKGIDSQDAIAVNVNDTFFMASKLGPINVTANESNYSNVFTRGVVLFIICLLALISIFIVWRRKGRRTV